METIRELEEKLKKAREAEKAKSLEDELKKQKEAWLGKARATHTFQRIRKQIHAYVEKVVDVVISDNDILLKVESIEFTRNNETLKIEVREIHKAWHQYHHYTYDITPEEYDYLKSLVSIKLVDIGETFREGMRRPDEHHTMGDMCDYRNIEQRLTAVGAPVINLEKIPKFVRILAWQHHPMLMGNVLLINEYTVPILKTIKQGFLKLADRSFSGVNVSHHHKDANLIQAIIDYYIKETTNVR
jgi:hypothetical protein